MELDQFEDDPTERKLLELNRTEETQEKLYNEKIREDTVGNVLSFDEAQNLVKKGFKNTIEHDDLWRIGDDSRANVLYNKFYPIWRRELKRTTPSLPRAISLFFVRKWFIAIFYQVLYGLLGFINPLLIPYMITYMTDDSVPFYNGILYALAILGSNIVGSFCYYQSMLRADTIGFQVRSLLLTLAYRKVTTLAPNNTAYDSGKLVNVVASDSQFISDTIIIFLIGFSAPIQIAATVGLLSISVGIFTLLTLGVLLVVLPIVGGLGSRFGPFRKIVAAISDIRLKYTNELLNNIKTVKFYAWEDSFKRRIFKTRGAELVRILKMLFVRSFMFIFMANTNTICVAVIITLYAWYGGDLTPNISFVVVAMFNLLKAQWFWMPLAIAYVDQYKVGLHRIQSFLLQPDIEQVNSAVDFAEISIVKGTFSWKTDKTSPCLRDIDFKVRKGDLIGVVGPVGSGKSSLVGAILGEAMLVSGDISVSGSLAYAPQAPWIINASVRQNILFGEPYDEEKYRRVLVASALMTDLKQLSRGDLTEIGERGAILSGGQKARISFARALYSERDVYIFDDPLSAVDNQVSNVLFDEGIKKFLKDKTVILVTNQLTVLPHVDRVYCLDEGQVVLQGKYNDLLNSSTDFRSQMKRSGVVTEDEVLQIESRPQIRLTEGLMTNGRSTLSRKFGFNLTGKTIGASLLQRKATGRALVLAAESNNLEDSETMSIASKAMQTNVGVDDTIDFLDAESASRLLITVPPESFKEKPVHIIPPEKSGAGLISMKVYWYYFKAGGLATFFFMCLSFLLSVGAKVASSWWLAVWIQGEDGPFGLLDKMTYTLVYACACAGEFFFNLVGFLLLVAFSYSSSKRLHNSLLSKVLRAPMSFFDTTPIGRIINRFAKELSMIDDILAIQLAQFLISFFNVLGIFASASFILPYISIAIVPLGIGYGFFQYYYRRTSIQIQRLEAASRAPIFSHFGESFRGASTLRAYGMQNTFTNMCNYFIDYNTTEKFALRYTMNWFGIRLDMLGSALVLIVLVVLICFRNFLPGFVTPAFVGLALSSLPGLTNTLSNMSQKLVDTETKLNSVEKFYEYENLPQEAPAINENYRPPSSWPQTGAIEFKNFSFAYTPGGDNVLRNLNFTIENGHKIGCVGRTGAGKSSLIQALFRINEPAAGTILIDGVDISRIGLKDLRLALAIIPQEPTLFIGSIRYNLDPPGEFLDERLWEALEHVKLKKFVQGLPGGLDFEVGEGGSNFSIGQRQLFCLARALIRKTRILLTDEATASVDIITDSKIQTMIRDHFSERTVLTIAHRLNTVMDNTKILVLDKGKKVQYASPAELVDEPGHFKDLVNAAPNAKELKKIARGTMSLKAKLVEAIEEARSLVRRAQSRLLWADVKAAQERALKEEEGEV